MEKQCFKCGRIQDLAQFYAHPKMKDGHLGKCKACTKRDVVEHRVRNLGRIRAYDSARAKLPHRKQSHRMRQLRYRQRHPERPAVNQRAERAVRRGILEKSAICEQCGLTCKTCAHHTDYDQPLVVVWLCYSCHRRVHRVSAE